MVEENNLNELIKAEALRLGFVLCSPTTPEPPPNFRIYKEWLKADHHAGMDYLARPDQITRRQNPRLLMDDVQSILVLAAPYPKPDPSASTQPGVGRVSSYAWGKDYHMVLKDKLDRLAQWLCATLEIPIHHMSFTDSSPVSERDLACRAGLGWIGKNTCLISPHIGSFFFLSELFVNFPLPPAAPFVKDHCGSCRRCIEACPTHCLGDDRTMDARRCISYLTIENKSEIPMEHRSQIKDWIFGCDICQQVCPWNQKTKQPILPEFTGSLPSIELGEILRVSDIDFRKRFAGSPLQRTKRNGLIRNAIVVTVNQKLTDLTKSLIAIRDNDPDTSLRNLADWAVQELRK